MSAPTTEKMANHITNPSASSQSSHSWAASVLTWKTSAVRARATLTTSRTATVTLTGFVADGTDLATR